MPTNEMPEVQRYEIADFEHLPGAYMNPSSIGRYVLYSDLLTEREAHKREVEGLKVWQDRWGSLYERLVLRSHAGVKIDAGEVLDMMDVLREQFPLPPDPPQEVKGA